MKSYVNINYRLKKHLKIDLDVENLSYMHLCSPQILLRQLTADIVQK